MDFSLWPSPDRRPDVLLEEARRADADGWHGLWFADHYMPNRPDGAPADGPVHEVWGLLPAVAAVTGRVRVGTLVSPTSVHHPAVLANRAATVDHVSGGRMVLGLGAGWQVNEHRAYGIALEEPGPRVTRFDEAIQVVRSLLSQERTTFRGSVYDVVDAPCDPRPVQPRLPLLVGTNSPRMLRITARHADEWNTWGNPERAARTRVALAEACDAVGRDVAGLRTSANVMLVLDGVGAEKARTPHVLSGSAQQLVDQLGRYVELGYDELVLPDWHLGTDATERADNLARLRTDVLEKL